ncbi:MAG: TIGR00266 family protein [Alphaproteobacteria bacterium]|nr:TIGR00266 family protein [Alphaproteobacteria bacterium]|tara:strand:- start:233 stop:925 length:693 start_codon:yes stop_codon:yes gene_type:complete
MQIEILAQPANTLARLTFNAGEEITAEGGSMVAMSGGLNVETSTHKRGQRGLWKATKRAFAGEGIFLNHYRAEREGANLYIAPVLSGDIMVQELTGNALIVQATSFLAHESGVDLDMGWKGLKSMFSGEGLFWLKMEGHGKALINAFGAIYPVEVDGEYIVDTGHIVAFDDSLDFSLSKAGKSWMSSILGGEGIVCRFKGKGAVWCQSHSPSGFGHAIGQLLEPIVQHQQ